MIRHIGIIQTLGWIIIRKMQVVMIQDANTVRNNLTFAIKGLIFFIGVLRLFVPNIVNQIRKVFKY